MNGQSKRSVADIFIFYKVYYSLGKPRCFPMTRRKVKWRWSWPTTYGNFLWWKCSRKSNFFSGIASSLYCMIVKCACVRVCLCAQRQRESIPIYQDLILFVVVVQVNLYYIKSSKLLCWNKYISLVHCCHEYFFNLRWWYVCLWKLYQCWIFFPC